MAEIAPDMNVHNQVLMQRYSNAVINEVGMASHILVCERTIDEQAATIAVMQEKIDQQAVEIESLRNPPSGATVVPEQTEN
jgi:hypothetical protein